jgi:TRAP-type C4-dicarboxylate transport system substrate-binding protein
MRRHTTRRIAIAAAAGLLALSAPAAAQDKPAALKEPTAQDKPVELRFSHALPQNHPMHTALEAWAASIGRASNGTVVITVHPAGQLGKAFDHYDMAREGVAAIAHVDPGHEHGRFPIMALSEMPFIIANAKEGSAALDAWYRKYAEREMKDVKYCLTFAQAPATFHTANRKVAVPGDLKDARIRPGNATISRIVSRAGGTNVPGSARDARDLLARNMADGVTFPWGTAVQLGIDRVTRYHLDAPLYVTAQVLVINRDGYNALSPAQRKAIDDHCTSAWAEIIATPWAAMESSGRDRIRAQPGHEAYTVTPAQLAEWRKAAAPLKKEWEAQVKKAGGNPGLIFKDLQDELRKRNSLY